jgi:hypothetical protein
MFRLSVRASLFAAVTLLAGCNVGPNLANDVAPCQADAECPQGFRCGDDHHCLVGATCGRGQFAKGLACVACSKSCPDGQYESAACSVTKDRQCSSCNKIANCASVSCSSGSDETCTACEANHFLDGGSCQACSGACPAGEQQSAACTATTDRACTSCNVIANCTMESCSNSGDPVCSSCAGGFFLQNNACVACSGACQAGEFESAACSATADRLCSSCTAITNCASVSCTSDSDQTCTTCDADYFSSGGSCQACSGACPSGEQQSAACTATTDRACTNCDVIPNCTAESCTDSTNEVCSSCAGGFYLHNNRCVACSGSCQAGEYESAACSATTDRVCSTCTAIANCASVSCTTASDQTCTSCDSGEYLSNGTCQSCSGACQAGEFESAACTATADRVCSTCAAVANCTSVACTTASDQTCTACDASHYLNGGSCQACSGACPAGEQQSAACTATTDRACTSCTVIPNCTMESCTNSSDAVCGSCAGGFYLQNNACVACSGACQTGQYQSAICSGYADRLCSSCTAIANCASVSCTTGNNQVCNSCADGFYLQNNACVPCSLGCGAGEYQSAACSARADRVCSSCTAIANCASVACTTVSDQTCTGCDNNYFWDGASCQTCSGACPAGEQQSAACTATSDRACTSCTVIENCTMESCSSPTDAVCSSCAGGFYLQNNACVTCSDPCQPGEYQSAACSANADRTCGACTAIADCTSETCTTDSDQVCNSCADGFYLQNNACVRCSDPCQAGQFEVAACSPDADRLCSSCTAIANCASVSCTTVSDQTCTACNDNYFWNGATCETCSGACPAGQQQSAACTATSDRACTSCTVIANCTTETCTNPTDEVCSSCAGGFYLQNNACVACSGACEPGYYESAACTPNADHTCASCTAIADCTSETCTTDSDQVCNSCAAGSYLDNNTCVACSVGCAAGAYESAACSATADRTCASCTAIADCTSETCTTDSDQVCNSCAAGLYLDHNSCIPCSVGCAAGTYESTACSANADHVCTSCTSITNCTSETCTTGSDQVCNSCAGGFYLDHNTCVPCSVGCAAGQYQNAACSANADRTCASCTSIPSCTSETCTTGSDQVCNSCASGFYLGHNSCIACSVGCAAGQYESTACSASADHICSDCASIASCVSETCTTGSDQLCTACDATHFVNNGACALCSSCSNGQYQTAACTTSADTTCTNCTAACGAGTYESTACTSGSNRVCSACATGCSSCTGASACTACSSGYSLVAGACNAWPLNEPFPTVSGGSTGTQCTTGNTVYASASVPGWTASGTNAAHLVDVAGNKAVMFYDTNSILLNTGVAANQNGQFYTIQFLGGPAVWNACGQATAAGDGLIIEVLRADNSVLASFNYYPAVWTGTETLTPATLGYFGDGSGVVRLRISDNLANGRFGGAIDDIAIYASTAPAATPVLPPVTSGLIAQYTTRSAGSITKNGSNVVSQWRDVSGNNNHLNVNGTGPTYGSGLLNGKPAMDFGGGKGMISGNFGLSTEVTVFAVIQYRSPGSWGPIAHHGNRDMDWSLEQNGTKGTAVTHFQSNNDNANVELSLNTGTNYVLAGRVTGSTRYYSATTNSTVSTSGGSGVSITAGSKALYVGLSDVNEPSNAYIGELVYYNRSLSDVERDQVISFLRSAWGFGFPQPDFLWLDAADGSTITKDGSNHVSQWRDKSGLGRHANVGGDTAPTWSASSGPNNLPTIAFSGGTVRLTTASVPSSPQMTIFTAHVMNSPQQWGTIIEQAHDTYFATRISDPCCGGGGNLNFHIRNTNNAPLLAPNFNTWEVLTQVQDASTTTMYYSAASPASVAQGPITSGSAALSIGNSSLNNQSMGGSIGEIRAYGSALHPTDRAAIEGDLDLKWGLFPGLVDCWSGEGNGTDVVSANNMSVFSDVTFAAGKSGQAFTCTGASNTRSTNAYATYRPAVPNGGPWTYEFWIKRDSSTGDAWVFDRDYQGPNSSGNGTPIIELHTDGSGNCYWLMRNDAGTLTSFSSFTLPASEWHHVAITRNGSTYTAYRDAVSVGTLSLAGTLTPDPPRICGFVGAPNSYMTGQFDSLRIWNRALTANELANVAAGNGSCAASP